MEFKFKIQQYQTAAVAAVADVFEGQPSSGPLAYLRDIGTLLLDPTFAETQEGYGNAQLMLTPDELLRNVRRVQSRNQIIESEALSHDIGAVQLDVEMETGTGKTYVYTKTMFELNRLYGWTKFIVVVPSIAIREGVHKSLQTTEQHFFEQYGKKIRYFVYNSDRLNELDAYSQSSDINVMIINMQAFNTSMKEGGRSKQARKMYSELDDFGSRRPIDVIAANRPIVIQDEPQKMGGRATQDGIKRFNPLFCLNYSATHRVQHNMVYELDALDAYNVYNFCAMCGTMTPGKFVLSHMAPSDNKVGQIDAEVYEQFRQVVAGEVDARDVVFTPKIYVNGCLMNRVKLPPSQGGGRRFESGRSYQETRGQDCKTPWPFSLAMLGQCGYDPPLRRERVPFPPERRGATGAAGRHCATGETAGNAAIVIYDEAAKTGASYVGPFAMEVDSVRVSVTGRDSGEKAAFEAAADGQGRQHHYKFDSDQGAIILR